MNLPIFATRHLSLLVLVTLALSGCEQQAPVAQANAPATVSTSASQVATVAPSAPTPTAPEPDPSCRENKRELVEFLRQRRFLEIGERIDTLHTLVLVDECSDRWLGYAFSAFTNTDPELESALDQWVHDSPRSAYALAARGIYRLSKGWHSRGARFATATPPDQLRAMEQQFEQASADLHDAIDKLPTLTPAYAQLLELATASSGPLQEMPVYVRGIEISEYSFELHRAALKRLQPRWGGSVEGMAHYLSLVRQAEAADPELAILRGYRYLTAAEDESSEGNYDKALELVDRALELGDDPRARARRAYILSALQRDDEAAVEWRTLIASHMLESNAWYRLGHIALRRGQTNQAIEAFTQSLIYDGGDPDTLRMRARAYVNAKRMEAALADMALASKVAPSRYDIATEYAEQLYAAKRSDEALAASERALELNPQNARAWRYQGLIAIQRKDAAMAIAALNQAIALGPNNAQAYYERAWVRDRMMSDTNAALPDYRKAAELETNSVRYWYALAEGAFKVQTCDVVAAARRYVQLCDAGRCSREHPERIAWAREQASHASYAKRCPKEFANN